MHLPLPAPRPSTPTEVPHTGADALTGTLALTGTVTWVRWRRALLMSVGPCPASAGAAKAARAAPVVRARAAILVERRMIEPFRNRRMLLGGAPKSETLLHVQ